MTPNKHPRAILLLYGLAAWAVVIVGWMVIR